MKIWECKIGECNESDLRSGADAPMRSAIADAYRVVTGKEPEFIFSGWGAELTEGERAVVENRAPRDQTPRLVPDRIVELATRLVASGPKAAHVSASECHEISEFIHNLAATIPASPGVVDEVALIDLIQDRTGCGDSDAVYAAGGVIDLFMAAAPPAEAPAERVREVLDSLAESMRFAYLHATAIAIAPPMTAQEVEQWASVCNHEPARKVLREYIQLRFNGAAAPAAPAEGDACGKCGARQPLRHSPDCGIVAPRATGGREELTEQGRKALNRSASELRGLIDQAEDMDFDEMTVAALETAIESMVLRAGGQVNHDR